jgi:GTP cyclohydrolase I
MSTLTEKEVYEILGDEHQMTSAETPLRPDAFLKTDEQKKAVIEKHFHFNYGRIGTRHD